MVHSAFSDFELLQWDKHLSENITKFENSPYYTINDTRHSFPFVSKPSIHREWCKPIQGLFPSSIEAFSDMQN